MQLFYSILQYLYAFHVNPILLFSSLLPPLLLLIVLLPQWWQPRINKHRLPPGSMGWPFIGETFKLYGENPNSFFANRQKRYGNIFKTHFLGCPSVMISSPEVIKTVLLSKADMFKPTYPSSKEKLIGPGALNFHQGTYHARLRKLVQAPLLPSALCGQVSAIENIVENILSTLVKKSYINALEEMKKYAFDVAMMEILGDKKDYDKEEIKHLYECLQKDYNSMNVYLPGTAFYKAMKARKKLNAILTRLIEKRRQNAEQDGSLVGMLLENDDKVNQFSTSQIVDNIIGVIFAAHDTTATISTWVLKYLHDNEDILESVRQEQEEIAHKAAEEKRGLTWEDTRRMTFTHRVILETLRIASIISFTFREAVKDVELDGYVIPKGWKVLPLFRSIHHCADFFPQPLTFKPSRFEVAPKLNTYLPFGTGEHSCPGNELAKLEILILLHHLTINYRWEVTIEDDGIQYCPFPVPKGGLPMKLISRNQVI